ncbi:MAG: COX15/CtaA family protein [Actinomycetes bacterium]
MLERSRTLVVAAWATLVSQIVIVGTGGAVRLTGSGLGCSEWPNCTPESFTPVPEQGIHGIIEFTNRVWGGIVVLIAVVMLVLAVRSRAGRAIVALAALVLGLTVAQALIGAVVVWMALRPDTVGVHFFLSVILVALSAVLVWRVVVGAPGPRVAPRWQSALVHAMTFALAVVVFVGVLTTGSGPHAGDGGAARNGLDPAVMQHVHAWPGYALLALVLAVVAVAAKRGPRAHLRWAVALLGVILVQILVGVVQSNLGLPILLVGIHMVLSVIATAIGAAVVLSLRPQPARALREPVAAAAA